MWPSLLSGKRQIWYTVINIQGTPKLYGLRKEYKGCFCLYIFLYIMKIFACVCSVAQSCPTLCNLMNCSMPGLPVHHQLLEFTQTHVLWVGDTIQPSHPLSSPSPTSPQSFPASGSFQMSQLFTSGGQSIGVSVSTSVLPMNIQADLL